MRHRVANGQIELQLCTYGIYRICMCACPKHIIKMHTHLIVGNLNNKAKVGGFANLGLGHNT